MREYIAFDSHKHYAWVERENAETGRAVQCRLPNELSFQLSSFYRLRALIYLRTA